MRSDFPDPDWYLENVLVDADPGGPRRPTRGPVAEWCSWWQQWAAIDEEPFRTAVAQGFVLTSAQFAALGVTRARCRHEVHQGRWTAAGRGAVSPVDVREPEQDDAARRRQVRRRHALLCAGNSLGRPRDVVSGRSAAVLRGLPTLLVPAVPELTGHGVWDGRRSTAHLWAATLDAAETSRWHGVPVETVGRTLVTLARHGRRDAIMAADAALREGLIDRAGIETALKTAIGWPWVRQARAVLALADPRAESPLESITRLALHDSGFPPPELQVCFGVDRVDFYWPQCRLVLEADGRVKYIGDASWQEKLRERRLLRCPEVRAIQRVIWSDVTRSWNQMSADLWRHFH